MLITTTPSPRRATSAITIMLFALAMFPSSRRGATAFSSTILTRAGRSRKIIATSSLQLQRPPSIISQTTPRFMSTKLLQTQHDDYTSMTIAELREMLRARGLKVSGIKADLIERLETGELNTKDEEQKPQKEKDKKKAKKSIDDNMQNNIGYDDSSVKDDLSGLLDQLREGEPQESIDQRRAPNNLVFAKEGDAYGSDDEWYDDDEGDDYGEFDPNKTSFSFNDDNVDFDPNKTVGVPRGKERHGKRSEKPAAVTFREDFQGTRVFVQGLPEEATWQDLKDHFQIAGEVVFASVSIDRKTGRSKQCGIVQFETPAMAQEAIRDIRNHPMNGAKLYVREDVQESQNRERGGQGGRNRQRDDDWGQSRDDGRSERRGKSAPVTEWRRANDENEDGGGDNWYNLKEDELKEITDIIEKRDRQRKQRNYTMSDKLRAKLKEEFGVHLDDTHKLWWTDTQHGGAPAMLADIKGEGRWGKVKPWRQIPTNPESDAMVDSDQVMSLLLKRDRARRRKDFDTADELLQEAHDSPRGGLGLRIHDESRTWRIWTDRPPPRQKSSGGSTSSVYDELTPTEMCLQIVKENEPEKVDEIRELLRKFPGREWNIFKRLKGRYGNE